MKISRVDVVPVAELASIDLGADQLGTDIA
jgi:hypothetical protein